MATQTPSEIPIGVLFPQVMALSVRAPTLYSLSRSSPSRDFKIPTLGLGLGAGAGAGGWWLGRGWAISEEISAREGKPSAFSGHLKPTRLAFNYVLTRLPVTSNTTKLQASLYNWITHQRDHDGGVPHSPDGIEKDENTWQREVDLHEGAEHNKLLPRTVLVKGRDPVDPC